MYDAARGCAEGIGLDFAVCGNVIPLWSGAALIKGAVDTPTSEWLAQGAYPGFSAPGPSPGPADWLHHQAWPGCPIRC